MNNPRVQGSVEAFGGLVEASAGGLATFGSGGLAAPIGFPVLAHGLDHFFTGMNTALSGSPRDTVTSQLLQKTGMSSQVSGLIDNGLSIAGTLGAELIIQGGRIAAISAMSLSEKRAAFNFTDTSGKQMLRNERRMPIQILEDMIESPLASMKDPQQASKAMMHYSQIWKNGKLYNAEVLYNKTTNSILHFQYTQKALGPLKKVVK